MTFQLNVWVMAAAIAVTGAAQAATVVAGVGEAIELHDAGGNASTVRVLDVSLGRATSTLFFSNGTVDPTAPPPLTVSSLQGAVSALNVTKAVLEGSDGAQVTEATVKAGPRQIGFRGVINIGAPVSSLTLDDVTGAFSVVTTVGAVTLTTPWIDGVVDGGTATLKNLGVDFQQGVVYAGDASGRPLLSYDDPVRVYGEEMLGLGLPIWTFGSSSGPTSLPISALLSAVDGDASLLTQLGYEQVSSLELSPGRVQHTIRFSNTLSNLKTTYYGWAYLAASLGLAPFIHPDIMGRGEEAFDQANKSAAGWGSLKLDMEVSFMETTWAHSPPISDVPEPEVYVLTGIGLVGLVLAVRRRQVAETMALRIPSCG